MKAATTRTGLLEEFNCAPLEALFSQETLAVIRSCSLATIERERMLGIGVPFVKIGRLVRYSKKSVLKWLDQQKLLHSTKQAA